ncbi:Protein LAZY 1 [Linum perenne]
MHRKLRQNNNEQPLKDLCVGQSYNCLTAQPSIDEQEVFQKKNYGSRTYRQFTRENLMSMKAEGEGNEGDMQEDQYYHEDEMSELFHGFLAIGTLGSDPPIGTNPPTPTFAIGLENITEKETDHEATENELKLINDELEKVLVAEESSMNDTSSARNSHVSGGRSSLGSTITLSGKALTEGRESNAVCPLQEYLFGSAVEIPAENNTVSVGSGGKKEHRTSLGELFQRTKLADEDNSGRKWGDMMSREDEKQNHDKEGDQKKLVHIQLMKKMLKKKLLHACSRNSNDSSDAADYGSAETKLHKIKRMFYRKVHPENIEAGQATAGKKGNKTEKNKEKKNKKKGQQNNMNEGGDQRNGNGVAGSQPNAVEFGMDDFDSNGSRECWIKTDAQYLVLEL